MLHNPLPRNQLLYYFLYTLLLNYIVLLLNDNNLNALYKHIHLCTYFVYIFKSFCTFVCPVNDLVWFCADAALLLHEY